MQITSYTVNNLSEAPLIVLISFTVIPFLLLILLITIWVCCDWQTIKTKFSDLFDETPILKFVIPIAFTIVCSLWITFTYFTIKSFDYSTVEFVIVILELCPIPIILIRLIWGFICILWNFKTKTIGKN